MQIEFILHAITFQISVDTSFDFEMKEKKKKFWLLQEEKVQNVSIENQTQVNRF